MSISEILLLLFYSLEPIAVAMLACAVVIFVIFSVIFLLVIKMKIKDKRFAVLGIFYELGISQAVRLSCSLIKLCLIFFYLVMFQELAFVHYLFLAIPCVIIIIEKNSPIKIISNAISIVIQIIAVLTTNLLCSYILTFNMGLIFILVYVLIAIATLFYSVYIFIVEMDAISAKRSIDEKQLSKRSQ